jgi:hypothetical protein
VDPTIGGCIHSVLMCRLYNSHYITRYITRVCTRPYIRKALCIQQDLQYDDFGSHCMLKMESSNFLMMMHHQTTFRQYTMVPFCFLYIYIFIYFVVLYWSRAECVFPYTRRFLTFLTTSQHVRFVAASASLAESWARVLLMNQSSDGLQS